MVRLNWDNPVVTKELRGRMRGTRTYWLLFAYLFLLSLTLFLSYLVWWLTRAESFSDPTLVAGFTVGRQFFQILFVVQSLLMLLITPALTAGAISTEREQRTFEMLQATSLPARSIVLGKLLASVSFVVLLLTASLPLVSLCFLIGGVSPGEVFFAYVLLIGDAFLLGAIGLAWSVHAANTAAATALSYGTIFVFVMATWPLLTSLLAGSLFHSGGLGALNPLGSALGAVTQEKYYGLTLPGWLPALLLKVTLGAVLTAASIRRLTDFPERRAGAQRGLVLLFVALSLFFGNGMIVALHAASATLPMLALLALSVVVAIVPILVTGEAAAGLTWRGAWNPRRFLTEASLPAGLPLSLVLVALTLGFFFAAGRGAPNLLSVLMPLAVLLGAVTLGIAGTGYLLSVLVGSRWTALMALSVGTFLVMFMPLFSYSSVSPEDAARAAHSPWVNTLYGSPFFSAIGLTMLGTGPHSSFARSFPMASGMVGMGVVPPWAVTSALWLLGGLLAYVLAGWIVKRNGARD